MNPAGAIVVKRHRQPRSPGSPPAGPSNCRAWYSAEFVGGDHSGQAVADCLSPEDAIGSLIRQIARSLKSPDDVLAFLAGLFADLRVRSVDVALARAVWIAAAHPRRENRGVRIDTAGATNPAARRPREPSR